MWSSARKAGRDGIGSRSPENTRSLAVQTAPGNQPTTREQGLFAIGVVSNGLGILALRFQPQRVCRK